MKQTTKSFSLPKPIADYFIADTGGSESVSECFTENAIEKDEGHTYTGRAAIKEWKAATSAKYQYTGEPLRSIWKPAFVLRNVGDLPLL